MIQKCSLLGVLEVFFREPTTIHFIREIGKKINLAPTSVKNNINELLKIGLIMEKESKPFNGYVANRENEMFLFYKKSYNLFSLYEFKEKLIEILHPKTIVIFGSYSLGEDIENSDIDVLIISKIKEDIDLKHYEKKLSRKINYIIVNNLDKIDKKIQKKVINGFTIYGMLE